MRRLSRNSTILRRSGRPKAWSAAGLCEQNRDRVREKSGCGALRWPRTAPIFVRQRCRPRPVAAERLKVQAGSVLRPGLDNGKCAGQPRERTPARGAHTGVSCFLAKFERRETKRGRG